MARRSAVVAPPPPPRRSAVVRAGGPKQRGRTGDRIAGILGALLLLASAFLVNALPEEDIVLPQYRVAFTSSEPQQLPTQSTDAMAPGGSWLASYDIDAENVYSITVVVEVQDDQPASLPDRFAVRLLDPEGQQVGETFRVTTPDSRARDVDDAQNVSGPSDLYAPQRVRQTLPFKIIERPTDIVVEGQSEDDTLDAVAARLLPEFRLDTTGTWSVEVTLEAAGGCPQPDPDDPSRAFVCVQELGPSGEDPGNSFSVTLFSYTTYAAEVVPLDA